MRCPWCDADDDRVVDSRPAESGRAVRRRRACAGCGQRFSTLERAEDVILAVRKRDGGVEPFSLEKLATGMGKATANLDIAPERVRDAVTTVERRLRRLGTPEVPAERVGQEVLEALQALDHVAYVRFASVYKGFTSPEDFRRELAHLEGSDPADDRE